MVALVATARKLLTILNAIIPGQHAMADARRLTRKTVAHPHPLSTEGEGRYLQFKRTPEASSVRGSPHV